MPQYFYFLTDFPPSIIPNPGYNDTKTGPAQARIIELGGQVVFYDFVSVHWRGRYGGKVFEGELKVEVPVYKVPDGVDLSELGLYNSVTLHQHSGVPPDYFTDYI